MRQIFKSIRGIAVFAGAVALACGSASSLAQARKLAVHVGTPAPSVISLQMYVAQQAGFFAENGLDVEVRYSSGAPQAVQLMAAGQADIALGTIEPLISGFEKGVRGKAFIRLTNKMIYYVAVPADSKVQRIEDLKGQNVGVANLGGAAVAMTRAIMRTGNADPVTLLPVGIGEQAMTALRSDKVQALGLWSNAYYTLERNGNKFRYFTHPTLGNYGNVVMMSSDRTLADKKNELCGFSRSIAKASLFIVENPSAALRMYWAAVPSAKVGSSEADSIRNGMVELDPQIREFDIGFPPKAKYGVFDQALLAQYIGLLKDQGLTAATPAPSDVATDSMAGCMNDFDPAALRSIAKNWKG